MRLRGEFSREQLLNRRRSSVNPSVIGEAVSAEVGKGGEGLNADGGEGLNGEAVNAEELKKQLNGGEDTGASTAAAGRLIEHGFAIPRRVVRTSAPVASLSYFFSV